MAEMTSDKKVKRNRAILRLPFGLCKRNGIDIGKGWTPRDAWDALKGAGVNPKETMKKWLDDKKAKRKGAQSSVTTEKPSEVEKKEAESKPSDKKDFVSSRKPGKEYAIKDWFMDKLHEQNEDAFRSGDLEDYSIINETEKAYQFRLNFETKDGEHFFHRNVWVPKSCTIEVDSVREYQDQEFERFMDRMEAAKQRGLEKYLKLYEFAISKGLKIRKRTKTSKILAALREAGITYDPNAN